MHALGITSHKNGEHRRRQRGRDTERDGGGGEIEEDAEDAEREEGKDAE